MTTPALLLMLALLLLLQAAALRLGPRPSARQEALTRLSARRARFGDGMTWEASNVADGLRSGYRAPDDADDLQLPVAPAELDELETSAGAASAHFFSQKVRSGPRHGTRTTPCKTSHSKLT